MRWVKGGCILDSAASFPQFLYSRRKRWNCGAPSSPHHPERLRPQAIVWVQKRYLLCVYGLPAYHYPTLDNNKVHYSYVYARLTGGRLLHSLFLSLFDRSGMEMPLSRWTRHQHDLRQTHQDVSFSYPFPFFSYFNIANTCNPSTS